MARQHGRKGRLYVSITSGGTAEPVTFLNAWTLDFSTDKSEVTAFDDDTKTYVAGLPDGGGTYGGFYDTATAQLYTAATDGVARKWYLYPSTTNNAQYFFGTAFFDFSTGGSTSSANTVSGSLSPATSTAKVG